jgi:hypothetical protein
MAKFQACFIKMCVYLREKKLIYISVLVFVLAM